MSSLQERLRRLAGGRSASAFGRDEMNGEDGGAAGGGPVDGAPDGDGSGVRGEFRAGTDRTLRDEGGDGNRGESRSGSPHGTGGGISGDTSVGYPEVVRDVVRDGDAHDGIADDAGSGLPSFGRLVETEDGRFIMRERRYPLDHLHGLYALGDLAGRHGRLNRVSRRFAGIKPVESVDGLLFFDTETTGLGVGAGNVPFMIGLGFFEEREFVVRQLFVRDPGEELAMLGHLRQFAERFTHLVTYNGKSFDWPVLANRFVLHRIPFAGDRLEHLDLLYISRNLWRNSLDSCRLSRVEEERLGIVREDDVPGYLAPVLYFQYLSDGDIGPMESVFRHNETDVLTLVTLATHLGAVLSGDADWEKMEAEDLYRTGLWLMNAELPDLAERPFAALLDRPEEAAGYAARLAMAYKKMRRYDKAVPLWEQAAGLAPSGSWFMVTEQSLEPFVELAIYHEHHSRQLENALRWTGEALNRVERLLSLQARVRGNADKARRWKAELDRRRIRLEGKLRRGAVGNASTVAGSPEAGARLAGSPEAGARLAGPSDAAARSRGSLAVSAAGESSVKGDSADPVAPVDTAGSARSISGRSAASAPNSAASPGSGPPVSSGMHAPSRKAGRDPDRASHPQDMLQQQLQLD